jgi:cell division protein FtsB
MVGKKKKVFFLVLVCVLAYVFLLSKNGLWWKYKLGQEIKKTQKEITETKNRCKKLKEEITRIKKEKFYLEKIAREELKMIKPGEMVYKIILPESK